MAEPLKVAFLGGGVNSAVGRVHKIALEMDNRFRLVAGCFSRHDDINQQTALEYGVDQGRVYPSLSELLKMESDKLDAIIILTPTPHHKQDVIACLDAKLPVICEKAIAGSSADAAEIEQILEKTRGFLTVTFNYTGYPILRELRKLIAQGQLGKIEQVHVEMPQEGFSRLSKDGKPITPQNWRLHDGPIPTISLDLGVHIHHMLNYLTNEQPEEVVAVQNSFGAFKQIVDNTSCIAKYSNDILCNIWFSKVAIGHRNGLKVRVYGTTGSAEWVQLQPEELFLSDNTGHRTILDRASTDANICDQARYNRFKAGHPSGFIEAFANHYVDIASSLHNYKLDRKPVLTEHVFDITTAKQGLLMLEAMTKSSHTHSWVSVE